MRILNSRSRRLPRALQGPPTTGGAGRLWRTMVSAVLAIGASMLVVDLVLRPSKRNIELLLGVLFVGLGLIAGPVQILSFAIALVPYPMHTSVGSTSTLLVLAVGGLMLMKQRQYDLGSPFISKQADLAVLGYALFMVLSLGQMSSQYYSIALLQYVFFAAAVTLYYMIVQIVTTPRSFEIVLKVAMVSATSVGVVGTLQTLFPARAWLPSFFRFSQRLAGYEGTGQTVGRVYASFPGISPFAEYVAIAIVFQYVLFRRSRTLFERAFWLASIALLFISLMGSATRMGAITLAFGFVYMLVVGGRAIPRLQLLNVIFIVLALSIIFYSFLSPLTDLMGKRLSQLGGDDKSAKARWGVMTQALEGIPDSPVFGHGLYTPPGTFRGEGPDRNIHNLYLTLAYQIGIPGLVAWVWFMAILFRRSLACLNDRSVPPHLREYMLAMNAGLAMFLVYEMTGEYITHAISTHGTWLRLGLLMALTEICRRSRYSVDSPMA